MDVNLAAYYGRRPLFPAIHDLNNLHLPPTIEELTNQSPLDEWFLPGSGVQELVDNLALLRLIVLARTAGETIPDIHNSVRVLMLSADRSILELIVLSKTDLAVSNLIQILNSAAHVFLHGALRNVPKHSQIFHKLLYRLQACLEKWDKQGIGCMHSLIAVLWSLVIGAAATGGLQQLHSWFCLRLKEAFSIFKQYHTMSNAQLEQRLRGFVWLDKFCLLGRDMLFNLDDRG